MLRAKTRRRPRGVLLVPVLKDELKDELAKGDVEAEQVEAVAASVVAEPVAPDEVAGDDDEPTEERLGAPAVDPSMPPPAAPGVERGVEPRRGWRPGRPLVFAGVLVALAFAGLLVGRALRDGGDETPSAPATIAASTAAATKPPPAQPPPAPAGERWGALAATPAGKLARPAVRAAATLAGAQVVVLGGSAGDAVQLGKPGGALRPVASLPSPRAGAAAFVDGGAVYLIGGEQGTDAPTDEILRFDLASHAVTSAGSFVEPLAGAGYAQAGSSMFLVGGWTGEQYATAVLRFTLPSSASVVARLPEATRDPAVALRGNTLYVAGGRTAAGLTTAVYAVDLGAGTVSLLGRLPRAVAGGALVAAGGKLYLVGGKDSAGRPVRTVVAIDPASGRIDPAGTMPKPLAGAAAVRVGKATYLLGGTRPTAVTRLEVS